VGGCQAAAAAANAATARAGVELIVRTAPAAAAAERLVRAGAQRAAALARNPAAAVAGTNLGQNALAGVEAGRALNLFAKPVTPGVVSQIGFRAGQLYGALETLSDAIFQ